MYVVEVVDMFLRERHLYFPVLIETDQGLVGNFLFLVLGFDRLSTILVLVLPVS